MADVIIRETGRTYFELDSVLASVLVECGLANYRNTKVNEPLPQLKQGWSLATIGPTQKPVLKLVRGGETLFFEQLPLPKVRKWNIEKQCNDYVEIEPALPEVLAEQFKVLGGTYDHSLDEARGQAARDRLAQQQFEQDNQNKKSVAFLASQGAKKL